MGVEKMETKDMARIALEDLYVATYPNTIGYTYDTGLPDEVFPTREEAQTYADECNDAVKSNPVLLEYGTGTLLAKYFVETLADRLQRVKDECRSEGGRDARDALGW
jgi:hypothetical protein